MILLIDNYDSFTYNLYQAIGQLYEDIMVIRNDKITIEQIQNMQPEAIIISPGPGYPKDAGISVASIQEFSGNIPILGVCLGHQSIAQAFSADIIHAKELMHGSLAVSPFCSLKNDTCVFPIQILDLDKRQPAQGPGFHKQLILQFPAHGHQLLVELLNPFFVEISINL